MGGAARVDINLNRRVFLNQSAGRARVIQMNVSQQNGVQVRDAEAMKGKLVAQCSQRGTRTGVNQRSEMIGPEQRSGNTSGLPGPVQIKQSGGNHKG